LINKLNYIKKWQIFQYAPLGKYGIANRKEFEITEEEFNDYKLKIIKTIDNKEKVQFKGFKNRNKAYMMIDNSGNAWIPIYDSNLFSDLSIKIEKRKIIGNIKNKLDWDKICYYLNKDCMENMEFNLFNKK